MQKITLSCVNHFRNKLYAIYFNKINSDFQNQFVTKEIISKLNELKTKPETNRVNILISLEFALQQLTCHFSSKADHMEFM
jgi:ribosomal protein S17E